MFCPVFGTIRHILHISAGKQLHHLQIYSIMFLLLFYETHEAKSTFCEHQLRSSSQPQICQKHPRSNSSARRSHNSKYFSLHTQGSQLRTTIVLQGKIFSIQAATANANTVLEIIGIETVCCERCRYWGIIWPSTTQRSRSRRGNQFRSQEIEIRCERGFWWEEFGYIHTTLEEKPRE